MVNKGIMAGGILILFSILTVVIGASMFSSSAEDLMKANHELDSLNGTLTMDDGSTVTIPTTGWVSAKLADKAVISTPTIIVLLGVVGIIGGVAVAGYSAYKATK